MDPRLLFVQVPGPSGWGSPLERQVVSSCSVFECVQAAPKATPIPAPREMPSPTLSKTAPKTTPIPVTDQFPLHHGDDALDVVRHLHRHNLAAHALQTHPDRVSSAWSSRGPPALVTQTLRL